MRMGGIRLPPIAVFTRKYGIATTIKAKENMKFYVIVLELIIFICIFVPNIKQSLIMKKNKSSYYGFYSFVLFITSIFVLPSNMQAKDSDIYLYEVNQSIKLGYMSNILEKKGMELRWRTSTKNKDSIAISQKDDLGVIIGYCPKSELLYSYMCNWIYRTSMADEFSSMNIESNLDNSDLYVKNSRLYFMNVHDSLQQRYGRPTRVWIHSNSEREGITIDKKSQLDTLCYDSLFSDHCYFEIFWETNERMVSLGFDNTANNSHLTYKYINLENLALRDKETTSIERTELFSDVLTWVAIIAVIILAIYIIFKCKRITEEEKSKKLAKLARQIAEKEEQEKQQRELKIKDLEVCNNLYVNSLTGKLGNCDKTIRLTSSNNDTISEILVFTQSKHLVIGRKELLFSDILDCIVNDDIKERETVQTFRGNSTATSKADTGSIIGRSVVGGVLAGGVGAVIGGSTAKRQTVVEYGTDTSIHNKEMEHNYTIAITIKDIANPVIYLNVGSNTTLKDEIVSLMKVIISMH